MNDDEILKKFLPNDHEIDVDMVLATRKEVTTTTIPIQVKEYIDKKNINVNRLIDIGFRQLVLGHRTNSRITELEQKTSQLEKAIERYDARIKEMYTKFIELKQKYKILEEI